jgi:hypothetical protein
MREEAIKKVLKECFCLEDNPFDPGRDPQCNFDFRASKASLAKPLDIFNINGLEPFFIKIGKFREAVEKAEAFIVESGWTPGVDLPPTFLVQAESGAGRSSLANYIAYLVKDRVIQGDAALHTETVQTEDYAQLVFSLKKVIEVHASTFSVDATKNAFAAYPDTLLDANAPKLNHLNNLFQMLARPMAAAPPLLVVVESITYKRRDWMQRLYETLSPLGVVLIFLTDEDRVRVAYDALTAPGDMSGCAVELGPLDKTLAVDFFDTRFRPYRLIGCGQANWELYPFGQDIFNMAFMSEAGESPAYGVKFLLAVFRRALNTKIYKLTPSFSQAGAQGGKPQLPPEQVVITWTDVEDAFRGVLRKAARARP